MVIECCMRPMAILWRNILMFLLFSWTTEIFTVFLYLFTSFTTLSLILVLKVYLHQLAFQLTALWYSWFQGHWLISAILFIECYHVLYAGGLKGNMSETVPLPMELMFSRCGMLVRFFKYLTSIFPLKNQPPQQKRTTLYSNIIIKHHLKRWLCGARCK